MIWLRMLALLLAGLAAAGSAHARIQNQMFCWDTDVEFPIACTEAGESDDEDEEEEDA